MSTTAKEYKKNNADTDVDGYLYTGVKLKQYKTIKPLISP